MLIASAATAPAGRNQPAALGSIAALCRSAPSATSTGAMAHTPQSLRPCEARFTRDSAPIQIESAILSTLPRRGDRVDLSDSSPASHSLGHRRSTHSDDARVQRVHRAKRAAVCYAGPARRRHRRVNWRGYKRRPSQHRALRGANTAVHLYDSALGRYPHGRGWPVSVVAQLHLLVRHPAL